MKRLFERKSLFIVVLIALVVGVGITFGVVGNASKSEASTDTPVKEVNVEKPAKGSNKADVETEAEKKEEADKSIVNEEKTEVEEVKKEEVKEENVNEEKASAAKVEDSKSDEVEKAVEKKVEPVKTPTPKASEPKKETKPAAKTEPTITETAVTHKEYQTTDNLNLRKGPSTNYSRILTIPSGKKVKHIATSGTWYKVKYGEYTGYVSKQYLQEPTKVATTPPSTKTKESTKQVTKPTYIQGILIANKKYALPADYAPGESSTARNAFNQMAAGASKEGIGLVAFSTYRSYATQKSTYDYWVSKDGQAAADRYSARPGTSEHQTGLAFDIHETGKYNTRFDESDATRWMAKNAHKYGFIVRYPQGKEHITGYKYEPWHLRYLGVDIATKVYNSGLSLEEYLGIQ